MIYIDHVKSVCICGKIIVEHEYGKLQAAMAVHLFSISWYVNNLYKNLFIFIFIFAYFFLCADMRGSCNSIGNRPLSCLSWYARNRARGFITAQRAFSPQDLSDETKLYFRIFYLLLLILKNNI